MCLRIHERTTLGDLAFSCRGDVASLSILADYVYINVTLGEPIPEVVPLDERTWSHLEIIASPSSPVHSDLEYHPSFHVRYGRVRWWTALSTA